MAEKEYIEREALKSKLKNMEATSPNKVYQNAMEDMIYYFIPKIIDEIPTADVAPVRHGCFRMLTFSGDTIFCSECKMAYNIFETNGAENFNFCPHCGARMDKTE